VLSLLLGCIVHFEATVTVEEYDETQMNRKKEADRHSNAEVHYNTVVQDVEVSAEEVEYWPIVEKLVYEKQCVKAKETSSPGDSNRGFHSL
jgi:hypothetical protein